MDVCEVCGKRRAVKEVFIEGALVLICSSCGKGLAKEEKQAKVLKPKKPLKDVEEGIVEDYAERIKRARIKMGLSLKELALKLNEKESYLNHIEKGDMLPDQRLAKKLEKFLGIKLLEKYEVSYSSSQSEEKKEMSLLDVAEMEDGG